MTVFRRRTPVSVRHPEHGGHVVPAAGVAYADDDPLVVAYPWAFGSAEDIAAEAAAASTPVGAVEIASVDPGNKRTRRAPRR
jgi:hypothetical protein